MSPASRTWQSPALPVGPRVPVWAPTARRVELPLPRDEGVGGFLRIARNVAADKALRQRVQEMAATFKRYEKDMVGIALVAHKPES